MPKTVVEKLVACLDEEIYKDHKMEIEAKKALDRQIAGFAEKESRLIVLFTEGSITQDLYTKKLTEYRQDKKKLEERLYSFTGINTFPSANSVLIFSADIGIAEFRLYRMAKAVKDFSFAADTYAFQISAKPFGHFISIVIVLSVSKLIKYALFAFGFHRKQII